MRPKYLEFVGLNSFQQEAKIDFELLFEGGLFGVFGKTGAGKTTILDAISYALYGEVSRKKINQADFINKNCKKMKVCYTFEMQERAERVIYRVERTRSKSGATDAVLYRNSVAIAEKQENVTEKIKEILGLTHTEFNKCIILPQGEFTQFIKQGNKDRLDLICKLFNLKKYMRLEEYVRIAFQAIKNKQNDLQQQKLAYEQYSVEQEKVLLAEIKQQKEEQLQLQKELEIEQKRMAELEQIATNAEKREQFLQELSQLPKQQERKDMQSWLDAIADVRLALKEYDRLCSEEQKLQTLTEQLQRDNVYEKELENHLSDLQNAFESADFTRQKLALKERELLAKSLRDLEKEVQTLHRDIEKIKGERERESASLKAVECKLEELVGRIEKGTSCLRELGNAGDYLAEHLGGALLQKEYQGNLQYFIEQRERLQKYSAYSVLYDKVDAELAVQIEKYTEKCKQKGNNSTADDVIAKYRQMQEEQKRYEERLEALKGEHLQYKSKQVEIVAKVESIEQNVKEKGEQLLAKQGQLDEKLKGASLESFITTIGKESREIERAENVLKGQIESEQRQLANLQKQVVQAETEQKNSRERVTDLKNTVNTLLSSLKYGKIEELEVFAKRYDNEKLIAEKLKKATRIETLLAELPQIEFTAKDRAEFTECKERCKQLQEKWDSLNGKIGANTAELRILQEQLQKKAALEKQLQDLQAEFILNESLNSAIGRQKFVNFIANYYLKNICQEANSTLLQLTANRYFLEYNERENDFFVIDNLLDGEARKIHTLSGGESFLVSLSLALALSSSIYKHSLNPIEFFFLDEGFGTLDSELVETVLDALTKLKKNNFIIGLISHVEELKAAIPYQLIVYRDGTNGSKIEIKR